MSANKTSNLDTVKASALAGTALAAFLSAAPAAEAQSALPYDPNKTFTIEYQQTPVTDPANPATYTVDIDCDTLAMDPDRPGQVAFTGSFIDQFDLPPYRSPSGVRDTIKDGVYAFRHIGGMTPLNHQFCTAQAAMYNNATPDPSGNVTIRTGQSIPAGDDRFCPTIAAFKMCTTTTADDATLSDVYRVDDAGNIHFVPENIR